MKLELIPVNQERWPDFELLFESKGGPHYCWCMAWRKIDVDSQDSAKANKKALMRRRIDEGSPVGILAYVEN